MKQLLFALLLSGLGACSKKEEATPNAPTIVGTWMWTDKDRAIITKSNGATTHSAQAVTPGTVYTAYGANGSYQITVNGSVSSTGTYALTGTSLTISTSAFVTSTVSELTANRLVITSSWEDAAYRYVGTDIFSR